MSYPNRGGEVGGINTHTHTHTHIYIHIHAQKETLSTSRVQILDETVFYFTLISLRNGRNPSILFTVMCRIMGEIGLSSLGKTTSLGEGKTLNSNSAE